MESVKVVVRCRPVNQREKTLKCQSIVTMDNHNAQCSLINPAEPETPAKVFTFDGAYGDNSTTEQIYNDIVYPIVECVTEGYNGTVFAYGQTGCGKSFSMQGIPNPPTQRGIIPRSFEHIFEAISTASDTKYLVNASYLEIYNEEIRDLLSNDPKKKCDIKEHPDTGVYIPGLSLHGVNSVAECEAVMDQGWKNRTVGFTLMNADSSRSHSIFTIHVEQMETKGSKHIKKGKLNLVDLAGSERQAKTGATGDRLKEATKINLSLSALGNVISALVDGKSKHIPYRDSKLTRLLQDSLGGNTKTLMVACLSPADNNYDETLSTLRYANRAKNIKNKPKVNEDPKDALLREYKEELERLKKLLLDQVNSQPPPPPLAAPDTGSKQKNDDIVITDPEDEPYKAEIADLKNLMEKEKEAKNKLVEDMNNLKEFYEKKLKEKEAMGVRNDSPEIKHVIEDVTKKEDIHDDSALLEQMQTTALQRLQELQSKIVGGEKAHDVELVKKRERRKNYAEKRIRALAESLARVDDGEITQMPDYDDMNAQLESKTQAIKRAKKKIQSLESEIKDLQIEFERERSDYLDTIRRQDQKVKLLAQILEKVQMVIRRDCNYTNIDHIRSQAKWDEDHQCWRIPEINIENMRLPPSNKTEGNSKQGSPTGLQSITPTNGWLDGFNKQNGDLNNNQNNNQNNINNLDRVFNNNKLNMEYIKERNKDNSTTGNGLFGAAVVATRSRSLPSKKNVSGTTSPEGGFFIRKPARLESLGINENEIVEPNSVIPRGRRRSRTYEDLLDAWPSV